MDESILRFIIAFLLKQLHLQVLFLPVQDPLHGLIQPLIVVVFLFDVKGK